MKKSQLKGSILLTLTAIIWGCAFVAQSTAMDSVGPFTFQSVRCIIGAATLFPVIFLSDAMKKKDGSYKKPSRADNKLLMIAGVLCGIVFCAASNAQQLGIVTTDPGKAGFITAMYIIIVPVLGIFLGKKAPLKIWLCIVIAVAGLYFLCVNNGFSIEKGDTLLIIRAVLFSLHILLVDRFAPLVDGVRLSCLQFLICAAISAVPMLVYEKPSVGNLVSAAVPILYAGIFSCGIAYTLQILGQKNTKPAVASLLMSLESFFAVVAQVVILGKLPTSQEFLGCTLMFAAILLSQLPVEHFRFNGKL